jgi:hypothetical protein
MRGHFQRYRDVYDALRQSRDSALGRPAGARFSLDQEPIDPRDLPYYPKIRREPTAPWTRRMKTWLFRRMRWSA